MEAVMTKPKCRRCSNELTEDPKRKCKVCLTCYPKALETTIPPPEPEKKAFLDVKMTEERVREIVRDELENWHIQKPSLKATEVAALLEEATTLPEGVFRSPEELEALNKEKVVVAGDWRAQAKALNISLFHKTKEKVLAEIAEKKNEAV